jgi:tetratricopeptide (TPR) repeat protein
MTRTARTLTACLVGAALFLAGAVGVLHRPDRTPEPTIPSVAAEALLQPAGSLDGTIASLQSRLRQVPGDWQAAASLGLAYVQQARITADPSYYPKAEAVLRSALALHPQDNASAYLGLAALAAARHAFTDALVDGERARRIDPANGAVYGVIGDALLELGRYDDALATFQKMVDTLPGLASYARVSYARELQGDVRGAARAMLAAREVAGSPDDAAWAAFQLGELSWNTGDVRGALRRYHEASQLDPTWVPPLAGLAKVAWARGHLRAAIARYRVVVERYPAPEHVVALGDLLTMAGDRDDARRQYELARAEAALFHANGVNVDLELALFDADHGSPRAALAAARAEWARRKSVHVADAFGWALHAVGRDVDALRLEDRALALGTRSALFRYHRGVIEAALGRADTARRDLRAALSINPFFSILGAPQARADLLRLGEAA